MCFRIVEKLNSFIAYKFHWLDKNKIKAGVDICWKIAKSFNLWICIKKFMSTLSTPCHPGELCLFDLAGKWLPNVGSSFTVSVDSKNTSEIKQVPWVWLTWRFVRCSKLATHEFTNRYHSRTWWQSLHYTCSFGDLAAAYFH